MRIGLFTDTYLPSVNGIVYVVEILRRHLTEAGHEVFVFAPGDGIRGVTSKDGVIRFPALKGFFFDEYNTSLFFPPAVLAKIDELDLDIIHFLTPGQLGVMAIYAAHKLHKPLVAEYCTDVVEYAEHYTATLPGVVALSAMLPFTFRITRADVLGIMHAGRPRLRLSDWSQSFIKRLVTIVHEHCQAVVVHSRKNERMLQEWQPRAHAYLLHLIPTGVDPLPQPSVDDLRQARHKWGIADTDEVVLYVGRLSAEKNLDMLIPMIERLLKTRPHAKLMYVGDFEYRATLEAKAAASSAAERIVFTGKLPRETLGTMFALAKVFVFPSQTDTQGLVLHEAALAGLPIVLSDPELSEVVRDGQNGFICRNDPNDMAAKVGIILNNPARQQAMAEVGRQIAAAYSERQQTERLVEVYKSVIAAYS